MYHLKSPAARAATVLVLAGGGVIMTAGAAAAAPATSWSSAQVNYSCSLSGYGQGMAPLAISASVSSPDTMTAGTAESVKLVTAATQIPAGIAPQLSQLSSVSVSGSAQLGATSGGSAGWTGQASLTGQSSVSAGATGTVTEIPSITATGMVTPKAAGSWNVAAPQSFQLQPMQGTTKLAVLSCTAAKSASVPFTATIGSAAAAGAAGATGNTTQVYVCTLKSGATTLATRQVAVQIGHSGKAFVGTPENVWMSSAAGALGGSALGGSQSASSMATSASLGLSGGYSGSVPLNWSAGPAQSGQLMLGGNWMPKSAGMFQLWAPSEFSVKARVQGTTFTLVCTTLKAQTSPVTVQVQSASTQAVGANAGTGANMGAAPNTGAGGSLSPSVDVALAAAGALVVLGGAGIGTVAIRRRRHSVL